MDTIHPTHVIALSDSWRIESVAVSPDGRSVYVQYQDNVIDFWLVLVQLWPQILGGVLLLLGVLCAVAIVRIARRPQVLGHPHCRRCNYDLFGTANRPCPECALDPGRRRPRIGRTRKRRALRWVGVLAACVLVYGSLFVFRSVWEPRVAGLFYWDSPAALKEVQSGRLRWLQPFVYGAGRIGEFDTATGKPLRTLARSAWGMNSPFALSPDGSALVFQGLKGELLAIDPRTSRRISQVVRPDGDPKVGTPFSPGWRHIAGFSDDSSSAFVQFFDGTRATNTLYRWDLRSGRLTSLLTLAAGPVSRPIPSGRVRKFYVLPGTNPRLIAEVPDGFVENLNYGTASGVVIRDLDHDCREVRTITSQFWSNARPHADADGKAFFIRQWGRLSDIGMYEIATGNHIGDLAAPGFMGTMDNGLEYNPRTGLLFVAGTNPCEITVRDTASRTWVARLKFPTNGLSPNEFAVSADARWVAAEYTDTGPPNSPMASGPSLSAAAAVKAAAAFRQKLVVFELPEEVRKKAQERTPEEPSSKP